MDTDGIGETGTKDVCPELLALLLRPGIGALVDRDDELRDVSQDLKELCLRGFHRMLISLKSFGLETRPMPQDAHSVFHFANKRSNRHAQLHGTFFECQPEAEKLEFQGH